MIIKKEKSLLFRFKNRPKMTFDDVRGKADQEFELSRDCRAEIEYSPKYVGIKVVANFRF